MLDISENQPVFQLFMSTENKMSFILTNKTSYDNN